MCKKHGPTGRAARISGRSGPGQRHFIEIRAGPGRLQLSAGRSGPGHADILKSGPGRATSPLRPGHGPDRPVSLLSLCADCWPWWLCCWPCSVCPALQRGGQLRSSRRAWGQSKVRRRQITVCARLAGLSGCTAGKDTRAACFYLKQREASGHQGGGEALA